MTSAGRKALRDAATLMIASKHAGKLAQRRCNYDVLLMKRNTKSNFMPDVHVFPGGAVDSADYNNKWLDLLTKLSDSSSERDWQKLLQIKGQRPEAMLSKKGTMVPNEVAFRICAIRETFEESGILVLRSFNKNCFDISSCENVDFMQKLLSQVEVTKWIKAVHEDATNFIDLCRTLKCVPDIWSLHEWHNWITPKILKTRFNTMFYTCFFTHEPSVSNSTQEMSTFQWISPFDAMDLFVNGEIKFGPPQQYEVRRFCKFNTWQDLKKFSVQRGERGCDVCLPSVHIIDGTIILLLPGDYLYDLSLSGNITEEELRQPLQNPDLSKTLHRHIRQMGEEKLIIHNYEPKFGHCLPVLDKSMDNINLVPKL